MEPRSAGEAAGRSALDGPGETVALRPDDFKVLSSDTRVRILKLLDVRAHTGTELGKELSLEKSTVHQHLDRLVEVGLVHRREDDRLWVYYELAPRGRRLLHPPRAGFTLLLSGSLLSGGASIALAGAWLLGNLAAPARPEGAASPSRDAGAEDAATDGAPGAPVAEPASAGAEHASATPFPLVPALALGLFALAAALAGAAWVVRPR